MGSILTVFYGLHAPPHGVGYEVYQLVFFGNVPYSKSVIRDELLLLLCHSAERVREVELYFFYNKRLH